MPYIGNPIYQSAFVTDQFSGDGTTTAFTMAVAPAGTSNVLVIVSGVVQDPSTYGVVGNTLTFSAAPPSGTGNISCRYLGVPVTGVTTTAYRTVTEFTATAGQTTFTPPSYNVGFINVYRNGVLLGSADYTATNGTTVVLATGAAAGNLVTVESFQISSVANAIQNSAGAVSNSNLATASITSDKFASTTGSGAVVLATSPTLVTPALGTPSAIVLTNATALPKSALPSGSVLQVVQGFKNDFFSTASTSPTNITGLAATITPISASSKILVMVNATIGGAQDTYPYLTLTRNGSTIASGTGATGSQLNTFLGAYFTNLSTVTYMAKNVSNNYLDSPSSTSALTYQVQLATPYNPYGAFASINRQQATNNDTYIQYATSSITLMEIAG